MNENFKNLLSQDKTDKYLSILLTTAKIMHKGTYRMGYRSRDNKLEFKAKGYNAIVDEINYQITSKKKYETDIEFGR